MQAPGCKCVTLIEQEWQVKLRLVIEESGVEFEFALLFMVTQALMWLRSWRVRQ